MGTHQNGTSSSARTPARLAAVLGLALAAAACGASIENRGYIPDPDALALIEPGKQNRDDVAQTLGSPSSTGAFGDDTWIYVSHKTSQFAFFNPTVLEQNVVIVRFDEAGSVAAIERYTLLDGRAIDPVTRTTPAQGKELTFLEQLVGNLGRFNTAPDRRP